MTLIFPPLSTPVYSSAPLLHMWTPCPTTHPHVLASPTNTHTLTRQESSLTKTSKAKVFSTTKGREQPLFFPFLAASPPLQLPSLFPLPHPSAPLSKSMASQEGKRRTSYLHSPPEGPTLGYPYPQLLLGSSVGRECRQGPADSSQMFAKCSYVITVFSILPSRPL